MSRIEEALRRARSTALAAVPPQAQREPAVPREMVPPEMVPAEMVPAEMVLPPDAANAACDDVELADAFEDGHGAGVVNELLAPPSEAQEPRLEPRDAGVDTLDEPPSRARLEGPSVNDKLMLNADMPPDVVEQYRKVAASLHQLQLDRGVKIVMIASAMPEDGKTITASNIALTLSESFRRRVLLIDADLRRPSIHTLFGTPNVTGLNEALTAENEQKLTIFEVTPHLSVLPSGRPNPDPMGNLSSERMRMILAEAGNKFEWVIVDTPPVGVLADAKLLAEMVHTVILVIGAGKTPFRAIERAVDALDRKRIAGVVLNRVTEQHAAYEYYDYYTREQHA